MANNIIQFPNRRRRIHVEPEAPASAVYEALTDAAAAVRGARAFLELAANAALRIDSPRGDEAKEEWESLVGLQRRSLEALRCAVAAVDFATDAWVGSDNSPDAA